MNAYTDLLAFLTPGETLEALVFGSWGWDGYEEPEPAFIPSAKQGIVLSPTEAEPLMAGWSFHGGYGAPKCYSLRAWTNERVIWVTQYDGATSLDSAPRHPVNIIPDMPGG